MSSGMGNIGNSGQPMDWSADRSDSTSEGNNVANKSAFNSRETKIQKKKKCSYLTRAAARKQCRTYLNQRTVSHTNPISYVNQPSNPADSRASDLGVEHFSVQEFAEKINDASNLKELAELYTELREDLSQILSPRDVQNYEKKLDLLVSPTLSRDISRAKSSKDLIDLNNKIDSLKEILGKDSYRLKDELELKHYDVMMFELNNNEVSAGKLEKFFEAFLVIEARLNKDQRQMLKTAIGNEMRKKNPTVGQSPEKTLEFIVTTQNTRSVSDLIKLREELVDNRKEYTEEFYLIAKDSIYEKLKQLSNLVPPALSSDISRAKSSNELIQLNNKIDSLKEILGGDFNHLKDKLELKHYDVMMLELNNNEVSAGKLEKFFETFLVIEARLKQDQRQKLKTAIGNAMRKQKPAVRQSPEKTLDFIVTCQHTNSVSDLEKLREELSDKREEYTKELYSIAKDAIYERLVDIVKAEMDYFEEVMTNENWEFNEDNIADLKNNIEIIPNIETRAVLLKRFNDLNTQYLRS